MGVGSERDSDVGVGFEGKLNVGGLEPRGIRKWMVGNRSRSLCTRNDIRHNRNILQRGAVGGKGGTISVCSIICQK